MAEVLFKKTPGKMDEVNVTRADGSTCHFATPKQGGGIAHDLVHYVVEVEMGLRGFLTKVCEGAHPRDVQQDAVGWQVEAIVECLQAEVWGGETDIETWNDLLAQSCQRHEVPVCSLSPREILRLRAKLDVMNLSWQEIPVHQVLRLPFPLSL